MDTVIQEIKASTPLTDQPLQTVFFGGGTPSLIPPKQLDQVSLPVGSLYISHLLMSCCCCCSCILYCVLDMPKDDEQLQYLPHDQGIF